jgi:hypothetical protein
VSADSLRSPASPPGRTLERAAWIAVIGAPVLWIVRIAVSYILVPYACAANSVVALHVMTIITLAAIGMIGWRVWSAGAGSGFRARMDDEDGRPVRFLAVFGLGSCLFFATVVVAEGVMNLLIHPCLS